jgi:hypothetical protein
MRSEVRNADGELLGQEGCLDSVGEIKSKLKVMPVSLQSEAHARMSLQVSEKYHAKDKYSFELIYYYNLVKLIVQNENISV